MMVIWWKPKNSRNESLEEWQEGLDDTVGRDSTQGALATTVGRPTSLNRLCKVCLIETWYISTKYCIRGWKNYFCKRVAISEPGVMPLGTLSLRWRPGAGFLWLFVHSCKQSKASLSLPLCAFILGQEKSEVSVLNRILSWRRALHTVT